MLFLEIKIGFLRDEKLEYFYTCKFRYFTKQGIFYDRDMHACYDTNSQDRAARWMLEQVNNENIDYFSKGSWFTNC